MTLIFTIHIIAHCSLLIAHCSLLIAKPCKYILFRRTVQYDGIKWKWITLKYHHFLHLFVFSRPVHDVMDTGSQFHSTQSLCINAFILEIMAEEQSF